MAILTAVIGAAGTIIGAALSAWVTTIRWRRRGPHDRATDLQNAAMRMTLQRYREREARMKTEINRLRRALDDERRSYD
jgi:HAMP domain-containing protein